MLTLQVQVNYNIKYKEGFDGRAKLSDGRANALPCPPLATLVLGIPSLLWLGMGSFVLNVLHVFMIIKCLQT